jgi:hypothetical protein
MFTSICLVIAACRARVLVSDGCLKKGTSKAAQLNAVLLPGARFGLECISA